MTNEPDRSPVTQKRYMLTNIGHKRLLERQNQWHPLSHAEDLMAEICRRGLATLSGSKLVMQLLSSRWIETAPDSMTPEDARLHYSRNPLQNLERVNYEMTTLCNFSCQHCRNGGIAPHTETDLALLKETAELFLSVGIRRFDFIGGEVSLFGNGWLELARHITEYDRTLDWERPLVITLYTNGWWLEKHDFKAAGKTYSDDTCYLHDMRDNGVTHILFSVDGPEDLHDRWRKHPGLYRLIFSGMARVKQAGINPRISGVIRPNESNRHLRPFARRMYGAGKTAMLAMQSDTTNAFSNFIDTAHGTSLRKGGFKLRNVKPSQIRCKAFFRPRPTIRILASGAIGICPLMQGEEGYGNIHEQPLTCLLNRLQETPLYKLHASGDIARYLSHVDPATFGETFDHVCAVRREVNLSALTCHRDATERENV